MKSQELKQLNELATNNRKNKFSETPGLWHFPAYSPKTINGLCRCIIHFIQFKGGHAERNTHYTRIIQDVKFITTPLKKCQRGSARISAILNGQSIRIDICREAQNCYQEEYQKTIEKAGGKYLALCANQPEKFEIFYKWFQDHF